MQQQKPAENKKKKNKNKNKTSQPQPSEQTAKQTGILNIDPKLKPHLKAQQQNKPQQQQKKQGEQKPNQPMVSSDELLKFKELMKKASSSGAVPEQWSLHEIYISLINNPSIKNIFEFIQLRVISWCSEFIYS